MLDTNIIIISNMTTRYQTSQVSRKFRETPPGNESLQVGMSEIWSDTISANRCHQFVVNIVHKEN